MKVLHILHSIERSGLESMLGSAVGAFEAAGVETHVLSTGITEGQLAESFRDLGYTVHHLAFQVSASFFHELYDLMSRLRFDVIHIHTEQAFFWYGLTARAAGVRRVIHHVHGYFPFEGPLRVERILQRWLGRVLFGMTSIAVSQSVAANERRRFLNPSTVVGNWVNPDVFRPVSASERRALRGRLGLPDSATLIVSVGACMPLKRHALILESLPLVRLKVRGVHYIHVGTGSEEAAERALAKRLAIDDHCHFLGGRDDVEDVLAACDLLVMPSQREGLPLAVLEAFSCGLPVVATDVPGLRDLVVDGQTGALAKPSADSMAAAVVALISNPALRLRLGAEARRMVIERHSPATGVAAWVAVYGG